MRGVDSCLDHRHAEHELAKRLEIGANSSVPGRYAAAESLFPRGMRAGLRRFDAALLPPTKTKRKSPRLSASPHRHLSDVPCPACRGPNGTPYLLVRVPDMKGKVVCLQCGAFGDEFPERTGDKPTLVRGVSRVALQDWRKRLGYQSV
jgi:hypothetical protein